MDPLNCATILSCLFTLVLTSHKISRRGVEYMLIILRNIFSIIGMCLCIFYLMMGKHLQSPLIQILLFLVFFMTGLIELKEKRKDRALMYFAILGFALLIEISNYIKL
jgi:CHASE2 domain-containing sensor protein